MDQGHAGVEPTAGSHLPSCVGRDEDLQAIEAFLRDGDAEVRCLTLAGDPGIGKTTLWEAGCERARLLGFRVLSTRVNKAEYGLSFAGLADLTDGARQAALDAVPGPQLQALKVAIREADPGDESAEPFASAAGFLSLLSAVAAREPLAIAIDDVQWLDPASATALLFAARRLARQATGRIRFLLCRRRGRRTALEDVFRGYGDREIRNLGPLTLGAIQRVLSGHVDVPPRRVLRGIFTKLRRATRCTRSNSRALWPTVACPSQAPNCRSGRGRGHLRTRAWRRWGRLPAGASSPTLSANIVQPATTRGW